MTMMSPAYSSLSKTPLTLPSSADQQLAYHSGHDQAHGHLCEQPRRQQDDHQLQEESVSFHDSGINSRLRVPGEPAALTKIWAPL